MSRHVHYSMSAPILKGAVIMCFINEFEDLRKNLKKQHDLVVNLLEENKVDEYLIEKRKHNQMLKQANEMLVTSLNKI